ncbi:MAG: hypothetical protein JXR83_12830 [Deltaproteobacteria bacterium]|nr:hypothetical protein [Deltaproteobacteria bacterium]
MIRRISELGPALSKSLAAAGHAVEERRGSVLVPGCCAIDWRETTGPITERALEKWIAGFAEEPALVLVTMGYFHRGAIRRYLLDPAWRRRSVLVEMGLLHYFEEELRPRAFAHDPQRWLADLVGQALQVHGHELALASCAHCGGALAVACEVCDALLCKTHMHICPLCGARCCHTDTGRACFHEHRCVS